MLILQGRADTAEGDRRVTRDLVERAAETETPALRVWRPPGQVAFGRRDSNRGGYEQAVEHAREAGLTVIERAVGGHAVVFTGTTVAFARAEPVDDARTGIQERYNRTTAAVENALGDLGVTVWEGEPEGSFCPGTHSLSASGKIVGLAQRVKHDVATVAGIVVVRDHERIAAVLDPVYDSLSITFDSDAVGSVARAGGEADPGTVITRLTDRLAGEPRTVETVGQ
ncbi:MAG: lipoate--protein ligase family protein [Halovenus sp.]